MLTREQLDHFDTQGYLVVEDVLDQATVMEPVRREYGALLDRLCEGWVAEGRMPAPPAGATFWDKLLLAYKSGCDWFQPMDISLPGGEIAADCPFHFGQAVMDMIRAPRLLDLVEDLIGPEITSNPIQHVRIKPPRTDLRADETRAHITSTDWHQDRGVTHESADRTTMVTVWIAVTDATRQNGCLQVQPGRHRGELLPHCEKKQVGIPNGYIGGHHSVPLPVRSGGVVVFHPMTPHASLINRTDGFRWSFDIRYNVSGQSTGRDHFPSFVARSRAHPETELSDAAVWRGLWEDARARLAAQARVPLYRWDANAPACA